MTDTTICIQISQPDIERIDKWRHEMEPADSREVAVTQLVSIALDDVEMKGTGLVGAEVVDEMALAISMALDLDLKANRDGLPEVAKTAHRIHETLQGIGLLLGIKIEQLSSVAERLEAVREAPDKKN